MAIDKNKAILDYLFTCPAIQNSPLYFNFINAKDNNKQLVTFSNDISQNIKYIDGSVLKNYTFSILDYRSANYQQVVNLSGYSNENVDEILDVQAVIDWLIEQNDNRNYPDFGDDCQIDELKVLNTTPKLEGLDTSVTPALAVYSVSASIIFLDKSKMIK